VRSAKGVGTTVTVRLPMADGSSGWSRKPQNKV
jgi:hypothetical protein